MSDSRKRLREEDEDRDRRDHKRVRLGDRDRRDHDDHSHSSRSRRDRDRRDRDRDRDRDRRGKSRESDRDRSTRDKDRDRDRDRDSDRDRDRDRGRTSKERGRERSRERDADTKEIKSEPRRSPPTRPAPSRPPKLSPALSGAKKSFFAPPTSSSSTARASSSRLVKSSLFSIGDDSTSKRVSPAAFFGKSPLGEGASPGKTAAASTSAEDDATEKKKKKQAALRARMSAWKKSLPKDYAPAAASTPASADTAATTAPVKRPASVSGFNAFSSSSSSNTEPSSATQPPAKRRKKKFLKRKKTELEIAEDAAMGEEDPLAAYMASISTTVKKLTNESLLRAKKEAEKRGELSIMDDYDEDDAPKKTREELERDNRIAQRRRVLEGIDHTQVKYAPFTKDFYTAVPAIAKLTSKEIAARRKELDAIKIRGRNCPAPIQKFSQTGFPKKLISALEKFDFSTPTPIQAQALPAVMAGRDVIGIAKTGSGKTLAFLLPMFRHIMAQDELSPADGPIAVIMAPTRELAYQIHKDIKRFEKATKIRSVCVYGGSGVQTQIGDLKRGAEVVVCTPGRMIDVLTSNKGRVTNLRRVTYLVLDEADRMFDMGFEPQIMKIIQNIRPDRQTLLFSATFPRVVEAAARKVLRNPLELTVRGQGVVSDMIEQHVKIVIPSEKNTELMKLISKFYDQGSILVFVDRQEDADNVWGDVTRSGYKSLSLHGGKDQFDRDNTLTEFKDGSVKILVATSVAARGLDVPSIRLVINYDVPNHLEDYVHRVGRTGRAGKKGVAWTFIAPDEDQFSRDIYKALQTSNQKIPEELQTMVDNYNAKRKEGLAQKHRSGFTGGSGYAFDEEEEKAQQEKLRKQRVAYGIEDDDDEYDSDGELIAYKNEAKKKEEAISNLSVVLGTKPAVAEGDEDGPAVTQTVGQALKTDSVQISTSTRDAKKRAFEFANAIGGMFRNNISRATHTEEFEINDYPPSARQKITKKDHRKVIEEQCNVDIDVRGQYIQPGRTPKPGERKLYAIIAGRTPEDAHLGKLEVKRVLEESLLTARPESGSTRYSVI